MTSCECANHQAMNGIQEYPNLLGHEWYSRVMKKMEWDQ